jgi:hypothetical protein
MESLACKVYINEYNEKHDGITTKNNSTMELQQTTQFALTCNLKKCVGG